MTPGIIVTRDIVIATSLYHCHGHDVSLTRQIFYFFKKFKNKKKFKKYLKKIQKM